jgi:hypothetical protein
VGALGGTTSIKTSREGWCITSISFKIAINSNNLPFDVIIPEFEQNWPMNPLIGSLHYSEPMRPIERPSMIRAPDSSEE